MTCSHAKRKLIYDFQEYLLYQCSDCQLIFNKNLLEKYSLQKYDEFYETNGSRFYSVVELLIVFFRFLRTINIVKLYPGAKSILDIGSGRGYMLYFLIKYFGFKVATGTQISKPALYFSREKLGLNILGQDLLDVNFSEQKFDIITIYHVLEHVENPTEYIKKIHALLTPRGKLVIEVPNFNSWTRSFCQKFWLGLDFKHHIFYFTPDNLTTLLKKYNFKIIKKRTFSLEYSAFTSTQSLLSRLTNSDHIFYNFLQTKKINKSTLMHSILFLFLFPFCFIINLLLYYSQRGENLRIYAEKI